MKKASFIFTIAFTLIGTAPLSASYWSEIQEYLPQWRDFVPSCGKAEASATEAIEQADSVVLVQEEPVASEPVAAKSEASLDATIGMQNLIQSLKQEPFYVKGAYRMAPEKGAFLLIQNLAVYAKSKETLDVFKLLRVAGSKFFQKPSQGANQYFALLAKFAQTPLKLDEAFVLNELKAIGFKMTNKKVNPYTTLGHLCALHALVEGQNEELAVQTNALVSDYRKCMHNQKQVIALAQNLNKVVVEREKRG